MRLLDSKSPIAPRLRKRAAFTLIEILLAISIATGLLMVAMSFYRQATELRGQILRESERLATVRLILDRLAGDLRTARTGAGVGQEFRGDTGAVSFMTATVAAPLVGNRPGAIMGGSDLVRISISTVAAQQTTNFAVLGLLRQEESSTAADFPATGFALGPSPTLADASLELTNRPVELTTEVVRYLKFRYWNGAGWQSGWTNTAPPPGVEIVIGTDPQPDDESDEEYPFEQFRRVVALPAGVAQAVVGTEEPAIRNFP